MAKKNKGCFIIAVIWAVMVTGYYIFMFDYKHRSFSWVDSIIALTAIGVLISSTDSSSKKEKEKNT